MVVYDEASSLESARARYFEANDFGPDGGYAAGWVKLKLGPVPLAFPNTAGRVRAVRYHDLHHVVTAYDTSFIGEAEIGGWEVASGCRGFLAAWVLNLSAMFLGSFASPRSVWRAFLRGRRTRNLYGDPFDDALLARTVDDVRRTLHLDGGPWDATASDVVVFCTWWAIAAATVLGQLALMIAPLAWLIAWAA